MLILHRYILKGLIPPLLINLLFLTVIFLMTRMLQITKLIVNYNVSLVNIGLILFYSIPHFLVFVLPMSVMLSILLTLMRMSSDNEIIALKSGGVSLYRLLPPILLFAVAGFLATLFMTLYGMPHSKSAITRLTYTMLTSNTDVGLKARTFNTRFKGVTLYVNEVDLHDRIMKDVFIEDRRNPKAVSTIVAPRGRFIKDAEGRSVRLRLFNGMINQVSRAKRSANAIYFSTYDINLDMQEIARARALAAKDKDADAMGLAELRRHIQSVRNSPEDYHKALIALHEKYSIPAACLALAILAIPLGIELKSSRRSAGLGMGMFIFIVYYVLMSAGRVLGEIGLIHPAVGLWVPNILAGAGGGVMLVRAANEKTTYLIPFMRYLGRQIRRHALVWLRRLDRRR
jgi:lipopolysaccharide export system permease protein